MFKREGSSVEKRAWKISSAVDGLFCPTTSASAQRSSVTCGTTTGDRFSPCAVVTTSPRLLHSPHGSTGSSHGSGRGRSAYATVCSSLSSRRDSVSFASRSLWCALSERLASADCVRRGSRKRCRDRTIRDIWSGSKRRT